MVEPCYACGYRDGGGTDEREAAIQAAARRWGSWWEFPCPECETTHVLPNPPFPALAYCGQCGKVWNVQKLVAAGYVGKATKEAL